MEKIPINTKIVQEGISSFKEPYEVDATLESFDTPITDNPYVELSLVDSEIETHPSWLSLDCSSFALNLDILLQAINVPKTLHVFIVH